MIRKGVQNPEDGGIWWLKGRTAEPEWKGRTKRGVLDQYDAERKIDPEQPGTREKWIGEYKNSKSKKKEETA